MKHVAMLFAVVFIAVLFVVPATAEEITIVGTGSGAEILDTLGKAFAKNNAGVTVSIPKSIGSGGAIKAVGTDAAQLGRVARTIKESEQSYGLTYLPIAKMPIVIIVNKSVGIQSLSAQQVCDIFSGKITNWKEVGGKEEAIKVVRREDGDSSLDVLLKSLPGFKDITITTKSKTTLSDPETIELVEKVAGTISFGTYANAKVANVDALVIDGKSAAAADYPYVGELALIFKGSNKTGNIAKFIDFVISPAAKESIVGAGGLSL